MKIAAPFSPLNQAQHRPCAVNESVFSSAGNGVNRTADLAEFLSLICKERAGFVFEFPVLYSGVCDEHHPKYPGRHSLFPCTSWDVGLDDRSCGRSEKEYSFGSFRSETKCFLAWLDFSSFDESPLEYESVFYDHAPEYCYSPGHERNVPHHGSQNEHGKCGSYRYPNHGNERGESNCVGQKHADGKNRRRERETGLH
jgi:hypothetical protein